MYNNIQQIRKEKKISLKKLSVLCHISKGQLSRIERGESEPYLLTAYKVSRALNKSVYDVFPE